MELRAQVPEGVRIRFAEARGKREKAQLRHENGPAQLHGGKGGVEFAQGVGLAIGRQAEQNPGFRQFAENFSSAGHQSHRPLKLRVLIKEFVAFFFGQTSQFGECLLGHGRPIDFGMLHSDLDGGVTLARDDFFACSRKLLQRQPRRIGEHVFPEKFPALGRVGGRRPDLKQRVINVGNECAKLHSMVRAATVRGRDVRCQVSPE